MTDDDLDRALFALPLATPPPGLRERIVALAFETPAVPIRRLVLGPGDIVGIGVILAVAAWLVLTGGAATVFAAATSHIATLVTAAGGQTTLFVWASVGVAIVALVSAASNIDRLLRRS